VFLEPPGRDLSFTDSAEDRKRWCDVARVGGALFGQASEVMGKDLGADSKRFDEDFWKINGHLADD
jgi:hypothetical protein